MEDRAAVAYPHMDAAGTATVAAAGPGLRARYSAGAVGGERSAACSWLTRTAPSRAAPVRGQRPPGLDRVARGERGSKGAEQAPSAPGWPSVRPVQSRHRSRQARVSSGNLRRALNRVTAPGRPQACVFAPPPWGGERFAAGCLLTAAPGEAVGGTDEGRRSSDSGWRFQPGTQAGVGGRTGDPATTASASWRPWPLYPPPRCINMQ